MVNPLRLDPSRTGALRKRFEKEMNQRFNGFLTALRGTLKTNPHVLAINHKTGHREKDHGNWARSMRGEFWLQGRQAISADGMVDDLDHTQHALQSAKFEILEAYADVDGLPENFRIDPYDEFQSIAEIERALRIAKIDKDKIIEEAEIEDAYSIVMDRNSNLDPRLWAAKKLGWVRLEGNNLQMVGVSSGKLRTIADALDDAYQGQDYDRQVFDLEVVNPDSVGEGRQVSGKLYTDVPYDVIADGRIGALREFVSNQVHNHPTGHDELSHGNWARITKDDLTPRQKGFYNQIYDSGALSDYVKDLYDSSDPQDALATNLDADTVSMEDVNALRKVFYSETQLWLENNNMQGDVVLYRGDNAGGFNTKFDSFTSSEHTAKFFARSGMRNMGFTPEGKVSTYKVPHTAIYSLSQLSVGTFDEKEFLVDTTKVKKTDSYIVGNHPTGHREEDHGNWARSYGIEKHDRAGVVIRNPTAQQAMDFLDNSIKSYTFGKSLKGMMSKDGDWFIWDGGKATHRQMADYVGAADEHAEIAPRFEIQGSDRDPQEWIKSLKLLGFDDPKISRIIAESPTFHGRGGTAKLMQDLEGLVKERQKKNRKSNQRFFTQNHPTGHNEKSHGNWARKFVKKYQQKVDSLEKELAKAKEEYNKANYRGRIQEAHKLKWPESAEVIKPLENEKKKAERALDIQRRAIRFAKEKLDIAKIADTQEFRNWFGESTIVDSEGLPLVIYHGTNEPEFTEFERGSDREIGIFTSDDRVMASSYARQGNMTDVTPIEAIDFDDIPNVLATPEAMEIHYGVLEDLEESFNPQVWETKEEALDFAKETYEYDSFFGESPEKSVVPYYKIYDGEGNLHVEGHNKEEILFSVNIEPVLRRRDGGSGGGLYSLFGKSENTRVIDAKGESWNQIVHPDYGDRVTTRELSQETVDLGYDGMVIKNVIDYGGARDGGPRDVYVIYDPKNLKSIHNKGTFDSTRENILNHPTGHDEKSHGNWARTSKAVDKDGNLLVLLHATPAKFEVFDPSFVGSNTGAPDTQVGEAYFFSTDGATAHMVADSKLKEGKIHNLMKVHLDIKKPLDWNPEQWGEGDSIDTAQVAALIPHAKKMGMDGVIWRSKAMGDTYIVFSPDQIKVLPDDTPVPITNHPTGHDESSHGNWARDLITDDSGNPKVFYHGTNQDFEEFTDDKISKGTLGEGHYFALTESRAELFSKIHNKNLKKQGKPELPVFMKKVYLKASNVLKLDNLPSSPVSAEKVQKNGYDAIQYQNEILVFSADQIKDAQRTDNHKTGHDEDDHGNWADENQKRLFDDVQVSENLEEDLEAAESKQDIEILIKHYNLERIEFFGKNLDFYTAPNGDIIAWDGTDAYTSYHSELSQLVWDSDLSEQEGEYEQQFNDDFWSGPGTLFHATDEEHVKDIQKDGIGAKAETRGMTNRSTGAAVFTTAEWDEAIGGSYGNAIFEIDMSAMKKDGYTPWVSQEPDITRGTIKESFAHALGEESFDYDYETGMSPNTIVIDGGIPSKYLKLLQGGEE